MQQMLLILLAIIVLALYAFGQQADYLRAQEIAISREMEIAMMDVQQIWGSHLTNLPFAEEIAEGQVLPDPGYDASDLPSLVRPIGPDPLPDGTLESDPSEFDDFDDYNGYRTTNYLFPVRGVDMPFTVHVVRVCYSENGACTLTPTTVKDAVIRVTYVNPRQDRPGEESITLEQIVKLSING